MLINSGANIFGEGISKNVLLESAIEKKHLELIELLIQKGVDLNGENDYGETPIKNLLNRWNINEFRKKVALLLSICTVHTKCCFLKKTVLLHFLLILRLLIFI